MNLAKVMGQIRLALLISGCGLQSDRTVKKTLSHVITDFEPCTYTIAQRICTLDSYDRP